MEFDKTCHAMVAHVAPGSENEGVGSNFKVLDYVDLVATAVTIAVPEAVVVLTQARARIGKLG